MQTSSTAENIRLQAAVNRLVALRYERNGRVAMLVETPRPGVHLAREAVRVVPGKGFSGDHLRKSFYRGRHVPGREVSAVSLEVLRVLGIDPLAVGDNLITEGLDLGALEAGDLVAAGDVLLARSPRPHRPCLTFRDRTSPLAYDAVRQARFRGALFVVRRGGLLTVGTPLVRVDAKKEGPPAGGP